MTVSNLALGLLCLGASLSMLRWAFRIRAGGGAGWILLIALQPVLAALLWFTLFPPPGRRASDELVLATANTGAAQLASLDPDALLLALPEAPALPGVARVPDLGTALREHPQVARLRVLGAGLVARDRDLARGLALRFERSPLPRGLVELQAPMQVTRGARWPVSGRVNDLPGGSVELLDPAGRRIAAARPGTEGNFVVQGSAPAIGGARFALRLRDAKAAVVETVDLPLQVIGGASLRVLMLAGGPDPELKYLRRWALDAGADLRTRISVGAGLQLGDAPVAIDAASLQRFDLLVLDERAWRELGAARRAALRAALRAGLGVLLRVDGPLSPGERRELQDWGFSIESADVAPAVNLPATWFDPVAASPSAATAIATTTASAADADEPIQLSRQPLRVIASDGVPLLRDADGAPLAIWRSQGQGRMALWWLGDSERLVLAGQPDAHGRLWGDAFGVLARGHGAPLPRVMERDPRLNQRLVACGLAASASIASDAGAAMALVPETSANGEPCAAYWPATTGWHRLRSGGASLPFFVRAADAAPGLTALATRTATERLAGGSTADRTIASVATPGPRWPWFLGWLLAFGLGGWLERRQLQGQAARIG